MLAENGDSGTNWSGSVYNTIEFEQWRARSMLLSGIQCVKKGGVLAMSVLKKSALMLSKMYVPHQPVANLLEIISNGEHFVRID